MNTNDIVVGSKWLDDAPGGHGEVEVRGHEFGIVSFRTCLGNMSLLTSAFRRLFRPVVPEPVPDPLALLVSAEEAFLISRGWQKIDGQWSGPRQRYDHSRKVALEIERGER